jgi:alkylation response protein AidB-like acyl-CoA dehydrogenase
MEKVQELKNRRLIFNVPTVADLLNNPEERLIGESKYTFEDDQAIINRVQREAENLGSPESGDESNDDEMEVDEETPTEIIELCRRMEKVGMSSTDKYGAELAVLACKFCAELTKDMMRGAKQTTLDAWTTKTMRKENGKE